MIQRDCVQSWIKSSQLLPRMPISWPWRTCKCIANVGHQRYLSGTNQFMMNKGTLGFPLLRVLCYWNKKKRIMKIHLQYADYNALVNLFYILILFLHLVLMLEENMFNFKVVVRCHEFNILFAFCKLVRRVGKLLGWGLLKLHSLMSILWKFMMPQNHITNHISNSSNPIHTWQVSLQRSCSDTCQIWMGYWKRKLLFFNHYENWENNEMEEIYSVIPTLDYRSTDRHIQDKTVHIMSACIQFVWIDM